MRTRTTLIAAAVLALPAFGAAQFAGAAEVGTVVRIGEPDYYGRVEIIRETPKPKVIYTEPVIIQQSQVVKTETTLEPVYLRVPQDQIEDWARNCHLYDACNTPVYFVDGEWYQRTYVPAYRTRRG